MELGTEERDSEGDGEEIHGIASPGNKATFKRERVSIRLLGALAFPMNLGEVEGTEGFADKRTPTRTSPIGTTLLI